MKQNFVLFLALLFAASLFIYPNSSVKVLFPNGGETLYAGTQVKIRWKTGNNQGKVLIVLYKQGVKHSIIARDVPDSGIHNWNIPVDIIPGNRYRIRVRLSDNLAVNDFSDRDFKILKKPS